VANTLGIAKEAVTVHQTRAGAGFGRRLVNDYMAEAAAISARAQKPVKLTWTREDDMRHDFFRAGGFHALRGGVDANGKLAAWSDHFISFSSDCERPVSGGGMSPSVFPGGLIANHEVTQTLLEWKTPCGPWRAPGSNVFGFAVQSFLHELAAAADRDPVEFLLEVLGEPRWLEEGNSGALHTGRAADVVRLAAREAGWGRELPEGRGMGVAFYFSHQGHIAEVAEVSVSPEKKLTVHKVTVAADVGPIVNRSGAENQIEGSVVDELGSHRFHDAALPIAAAVPRTRSRARSSPASARSSASRSRTRTGASKRATSTATRSCASSTRPRSPCTSSRATTRRRGSASRPSRRSPPPCATRSSPPSATA